MSSLAYLALGLLIGLSAMRLLLTYLAWRKLPRPTPRDGELVSKFFGVRRMVSGCQTSPISGKVVAWHLVDDYGFSITEYDPSLRGYRIDGQRADTGPCTRANFE